MNLQEDYCSNEVAKLLKEKGFDWNCHQYDFEDWEKRHSTITSIRPYNFNEEDKCISIPTHQMAMKWLREMHNIHIAVDRGIEHYFAVLTKLKPYQDLTMKNDVFDTYEEAVEAALKYALESLI